MRNAPPVTGYLDRLTYRAGDPLTVYATGAKQPVGVRLVRIGRGPVPGRDLPAEVAEIEWDGAGTYPVEPQSSCVGSFATVELEGRIGSEAGLAVGIDLWTTLARAAEVQTLAELIDADGRGLVLESRAGRFALRVDGELIAETEAIAADRSWTSVLAILHGDEAELRVTAHDPLYGSSATVAGALSRPFAAVAPRLTLAARGARDLHLADGYARGRAEAHFTGKIANPFLLNGLADLPPVPFDAERIDALVGGRGGAAWSLAPRNAGSQRFLCPASAGVASPLVLANLPNQGVTGPNWDATVVSFREKPEQYAAAHFHSTDLVDVGWTPLLETALPSGIESGVYGVELRAADGVTDTIPLFLAAEPGLPRRRRVAFLMPTFCYLAYANEDLITQFENMHGHRFNDESIAAQARSRQVHQSREFGASLYDEHLDGSGVHYSSALRPILDMRAEYAFWSYPEDAGRAFSGDLYLAEWLERYGYDFDVVTDEQLHLQGSSCLAGYDIVLTGSHPEYSSGPMLDALEDYRDEGGSLCYLGGNGFYWVTGVVNAAAPVVETRRGNAGVRSWDSPPGEIDLVSSWEPGGLWRYRGRPPQRLFGVGMAAAGGVSRPYRLTADQRVRAAAPWFFEGIEGELIGDVGFVRGAAAGDEIDRVDFALGTPPDTLILAASWDHEEYAQRATEEIQQTFPGSTNGTNDPEIHADLVYFDTPAGGSVFATGSIAYFGALLVDDGDNNASRALRNVLDHMLA
ncbi:MAG TPA: N,N-dimethylformamidase beta subunit family domain-containing protein [Solirubrobacterales bacterium]